MYKACKTPRSAQRQREMVECLLDMMRTERFENITVCELCRRAGIPRKAFYRYFDAKEDMFDALVSQTMLEYEKFAGPYREGDARTTAKDTRKLFEFWYGKKELLDILNASGLCERLFYQIVRRSCAEKVGASAVLANENALALHTSTCFSVSGIFAVVLDWYHRGFSASPESMAHILQRLMTQPLYRRMD